MGQQSVEGFLWTGSSVVAQAIGQIVVLALLARLLTPLEFGVVSAALVVIALVRIFTDSLIGPALTQRPDLTRRHEQTAFALAIYSGITAGGLLWLGAGAVASLFAIPELVPVIQVLSAMFLLEAFGAVPAALLQRDLNFARLSLVEMVSFLGGYAAVGVTLALLDGGVWALVGAQLGYSLVRSTLLLFSRPCAKSLFPHRDAAKDILQFGGGHALARFFNYLAVQGDYLVVGRWLSAEALGFYGRAYQLALRPSVLLGKALDRVIFPVMASVQNDLERLQRIYRRSVSLVASLTAPLAVVGVILGPEIVRVVLGPGWEPVNIPFQIFAAGLLFRSGYKPADSLSKAVGIVYQRATRQAVYALLVFVLALIGTRWGLPGVAGGVFIAIFVNYLLMAHLSLRALDLNWGLFARAHLRGLVQALAVVVIVLPASVIIRSSGGNSLEVLFGSLGLLLLTAAVALRFRPNVVLGPDLLWFSGRVARRFSKAGDGEVF